MYEGISASWNNMPYQHNFINKWMKIKRLYTGGRDRSFEPALSLSRREMIIPGSGDHLWLKYRD